jgi:hypothetical protein
MKSKLGLLFSAVLASGGVIGCGETPPPVVTQDIAMGGGADIAMMAGPDLAMFTIPNPPTLGAQIDRLGRPAVNTALTNPFELCADMLKAPAACGAQKGKTSDQVKDAYNAAGDPTKWAADWAGIIGLHLAIFDGADTMCGNQLGADPQKMDPTRYALIAGVLAGDFLNVDTASKSCKSYLGVELKTLQGMPMADECGGRVPSYDVIDATYSALAAGKLTGIGDGVDKKESNAANDATFPFLGAPN